MGIESASRIQINLDALDHNVAWWRRRLAPPDRPTRPDAPTPRLCAVVKADAYGLGLEPIARRLEALGVDHLAVYAPDQAAQLLSVTVRTPVLLLAPLDHQAVELLSQPPLAAALQAGRLHVSIHDPGDVEAVSALMRANARQGASRAEDAADAARANLHVSIDSGMSRGGIEPDQAQTLLTTIAGDPHLHLAGLWTHFAAARSQHAFTTAQRQVFEHTVQRCRALVPPDCLLHIANTFGALRSRGNHQHMVRIGLGLWGYGQDMLTELPTGDSEQCPAAEADGERLQPMVRWVSRVCHVKWVDAGQTVGYERTATLSRPSRLGIVPAGYGDGYPLSGSNRAEVRTLANRAEAAGKSRDTAMTSDEREPRADADATSRTQPGAPIIGKVNMDQIVIDLTDLPDIGVGDEVELISSDPDSPCALPRLAEAAGSTCYELLCRLSPRLDRQYLGDAGPGSRAGSSTARDARARTATAILPTP